mmetsp:Transcript_54438/g.162162  ORF Transcript_54438/g.162162 Transcript_54438/m.162162 type:complete len:207 (-) Transcript_54438:339-959(-)
MEPPAVPKQTMLPVLLRVDARRAVASPPTPSKASCGKAAPARSMPDLMWSSSNSTASAPKSSRRRRANSTSSGASGWSRMTAKTLNFIADIICIRTWPTTPFAQFTTTVSPSTKSCECSWAIWPAATKDLASADSPVPSSPLGGGTMRAHRCSGKTATARPAPGSEASSFTSPSSSTSMMGKTQSPFFREVTCEPARRTWPMPRRP